MRGTREQLLARLAELRREAGKIEEELGLHSGRTIEGESELEFGAYRLVADYAADSISVHAANGDYLFVSSNNVHMFGRNPEDLVGRSAYSYIHEEDVSKVAERHGEIARGNPTGVRYRLRCGDGSYRWVETRCRGYTNHDGLQQIVCITRDIEEEVQYRQLEQRYREDLEREREALRAQLVRADRMATLGTVASAAGHELRNVSGALLPYLEVMRRRVGEGKTIGVGDVDHLRDLAEHVDIHARHLLWLGTQGSEEDEVLNLRDVVSELLELLRVSGRAKGVNVDTKMSEQPVPVRMNRVRLEQVIINLLTNAADAVEGSEPSNRYIVVTIDRDGDAARFAVTDWGCGIDETEQGKVFEPYYTTKPPDRGTGLGLSVVKQIVEYYGGSVRVESEKDTGSTFCVRLSVELAEAGDGSHGRTDDRGNTKSETSAV